jgi:hypothetical protein
VGQNEDARVTIDEIMFLMPKVTRATVYMWAQHGKVAKVGKRGRNPLFRWGDIVAAERDTRLAPQSTRYEAELAAA